MECKGTPLLMESAAHTASPRRVCAATLLLALAGLGCWSSSPPAPAPPTVEAQPTPDPSPPAPPPEQPAPAPPGEAPAPSHAGGFTQAALAQVHFGMDAAALSDLLGVPGERVSSDAAGVEVLRFTDGAGMTLMARLEDGRLVRKTLLRAGVDAAEATQEMQTAPTITEDRYHEARAGMGFAEVEALFGVPAALVATGEGGMAIYRWADSEGASFTARFDEGLLTRKTGFYVTRRQGPAEAEAATAEGTIDDGGPEEVEAGGEDQAEGGEAGNVITAEEEFWDDAEEEWDEEAPAPPRPARPLSERVRIARQPPVVDSATGEERQPVSANRERRMRAKLPPIRRSLRGGDYELRIVNTGSSALKAGLRSGNLGRDVSVPAGQARSVRVGRGTYTLFFIHDDDPHTLHQGRGVTIDGAYTTDLEIRVMDESYAVDYLRTDPGY